MEIINLKNKVKINFETMIKNKYNCDDKLMLLNSTLKQLLSIYSDLKVNITKKDTQFNIDSLNFQNKLLNIQKTNCEDQYNIILNRIYGDNYKIYKLIKNFIDKPSIDRTEITSDKIVDISFTVYKDLDIHKKYDFNDVLKLNNTIHLYLNFIIEVLINKNRDIHPMIKLNRLGCNINYYINEESTNILTYKNKILSFIKILDTSINYHNKYIIEILDYLNFKINYIKNEVSLNLHTDYKYTELHKEIKDILMYVDENINIKDNNEIIDQITEKITEKIVNSDNINDNNINYQHSHSEKYKNKCTSIKDTITIYDNNFDNDLINSTIKIEDNVNNNIIKDNIYIEDNSNNTIVKDNIVNNSNIDNNSNITNYKIKNFFIKNKSNLITIYYKLTYRHIMSFFIITYFSYFFKSLYF